MIQIRLSIWTILSIMIRRHSRRSAPSTRHSYLIGFPRRLLGNANHLSGDRRSRSYFAALRIENMACVAWKQSACVCADKRIRTNDSDIGAIGENEGSRDPCPCELHWFAEKSLGLSYQASCPGPRLICSRGFPKLIVRGRWNRKHASTAAFFPSLQTLM
jgi:hypothetical protein